MTGKSVKTSGETRGLFGDDGGGAVVIHTDGGSRGNPGQAAIGVVVNNKEYAERIGVRTNNEAEYMALVFALKKAKQLLGKAKAKGATLDVRMDSELVVKQLNSEYKIMEETLQPLFMQVWNLRLDFGTVRFTHVLREENRRADRLVNRALDGGI